MNTLKHLNTPLRYMGLTGAQLGIGLLTPIALFGISIVLALVLIVVEFFVWRWYYGLQKKGDHIPLVTRNIRNASPRLIQDDGNFYAELLNKK